MKKIATILATVALAAGVAITAAPAQAAPARSKHWTGWVAITVCGPAVVDPATNVVPVPANCRIKLIKAPR